MRRKQKVYSVGDRPTIYLKKETPDELISLINAQSDLTLLFLHSMELYYEKYGLQDCESILPRQYQFLQGQNISVPETSKVISRPSSEVSRYVPVVNEELQPKVEQDVAVTREPENIDVVADETPKENGSWVKVSLEEDPYA